MSRLPKLRDDLILWVDTETTGLRTDALILEVAAILTDRDLEEVARFESVVSWKGRELALRIETDFVREMHTANGLLDDIKASRDTKPVVERRMLDFLMAHAEQGKTYLGGTSVHADRTWLLGNFPLVHDYLHYRNLDTSGLLRRVEWWNPALAEQAPSASDERHRAMSDIEHTLELERFFYAEIFGASDG